MQKVSGNLSKEGEEAMKIVEERGAALREVISVGTLEEVIQGAENILEILCTANLKVKAYYAVCIDCIS